MRDKNRVFMALCVYVDDLILVSDSELALQEFKSCLINILN